MSEHPEDKKPDLSNFPRGAISIKGLPVSRNARLPSIRIPRDLTLGAQPKRTFKPNIPVRREKRTTEPSKEGDQPDATHSTRHDSKPTSSKSDRGRGRGRGRGRELIQMEGGLFEQGIAAVPKDRSKDPSFSRSGFSSAKAPSGRKTKVGSRTETEEMDDDMGTLLRDDFIDDGSDEGDFKGVEPVVFPIQEKNTKETDKKIKKEKIDKDFNDENFAKDLGFDVQKISKFIKKEKRDDEVTVKPTKEAMSNLPQNDVTDLFKNDEELFLIKLPQCFTTHSQDHHLKSQPRAESVSTTEKETNTSISGLPEGRLGKIQILKSGQARLVVGSLNFQLDYVKNLPTKHEVVSVDTDTRNIAVLANVKHLLNVSPDIVGSLTSLKLER